MLEIIIIWRLVVTIGNLAEQKGLKKIGYQIMAVVLWLSGESFGGILASSIFGTRGSFWPSYLVALVGAVLGACVAFLVMKLIPEQRPAPAPTETNFTQETSTSQGFGRSVWIPVLVILVALSCLCISFLGAAMLMSIQPSYNL